jgi:RNase adaptor protein for sRNA GlmZ degradation
MDEPPPAQNSTTPTTEQPILVLISHSHRRPLSHPPDLKFDLRKVSNPPKHIRDAYDGRSKRLREHMMHMEDFTSLLDTAKKSIEEQMKVLIRTSKGKSNVVILRCFERHFAWKRSLQIINDVQKTMKMPPSKSPKRRRKTSPTLRPWMQFGLL